MAHTTLAKDENGVQWYIFHNGDYSGDITFKKNGAKREQRIPMTIVKAVVADFILGEKMAKLEKMTADELLGLETKQNEIPETSN